MTTAVGFINVSKHFGAVKAVDQVNMEIEEGEFFAMLGPSGSGKTTSLRLVAGFEQLSSGRLTIFGQDMSDVPPYRRHVNTVFQDYALFPHLSVAENVAYSLKIKKIDKKKRRIEADKSLELVSLAGYGDRRPSQLSGGQRQRVALARALINKPEVLLLDEPLGALDLKLREKMQEELKELQQSLGITFIFVTHDQSEAFSMADRVAVFNDGRVVQIDTPETLYYKPRSKFVAAFVGSSNVLTREQLRWLGIEGEAASLRPEAIRVGNGGARRATISRKNFLGSSTRLILDTGKVKLSAIVDNAIGRTVDTGNEVGFDWDEEAMHMMIGDEG